MLVGLRGGAGPGVSQLREASEFGVLHVSIVPLSVWTTKRLSKVCNHVILIHRPDAEKYFELGHATFYYWTLGQAGRVAHVYRG